MRPKNWFQFADIIKLIPEKQVWTILWQSQTIQSSGDDALKEETSFLIYAIAFPVSLEKEIFFIEWDNVEPSFGNLPLVEGDIYFPSDNAIYQIKGQHGIFLALEQNFETQDLNEVYLNQDVVLALRLKPRGDQWINPAEDGELIAELLRDSEGAPRSLKIRTSYLRDYLAYRNMGAALCSYYGREQTTILDPNYWSELESAEGKGWHRTAATYKMNSNGRPSGASVFVIHTTRENTDYSEDIPNIQADSEDDNKSTSHTFDLSDDGDTFLSEGRLWINKWLPPATMSYRASGEKEPPTSMFQVDNNGTRLLGEELYNFGGWLWFRPGLINEILKRDRAKLVWHTHDTGSIYFHDTARMHFGVNSIGLINIFCADLKYISQFHQQILVGFNIAPEGGVSQELLMAQKDGNPPDTLAPEQCLFKAFEQLDAVMVQTKIFILRDHPGIPKILNTIHRFRALTADEIYELANDLNRVFVERLDKDLLIASTSEDKRIKDKNAGSIKVLEAWLNAKHLDGRSIAKHIVGTYELRHGISHLPSADIIKAWELAGLDPNKPSYLNAEMLIGLYANAILHVSIALSNNVT